MTNDNKYFWASSLTGVFKVRVEPEKMTMVGYKYRDVNWQFHGAYAFVGNDDLYYTAGNDNIMVWGNTNSTDPESPIEKVREQNITMKFPKEHLVGISMTWDGSIIWISSYGRVGVVDTNITAIGEPLQLPGLDEVGEDSRHYVTNSFAMDRKNGIYIVTSRYMCKAEYSTADKALKLVWATQYHETN